MSERDNEPMRSSSAGARDGTVAGQPPTIDVLCRDLTMANRILAKYGVVDTFGHVSQRSPWRDDRFFISKSIAPERVTLEDIVELDLDGAPVDPTSPASYIERFIHAEIYRVRPDVQAVVHSHSPSVLPFTVVADVPMRAVCHNAGFVGQDVPVFEMRDCAGDASDMLIRSSELGAALADCLGDRAVVLMRGHGSTAVGASLPQAVFHAIYAEVNARTQYQAIQLGGSVTYLSAGESALATSSTAAVERAWDLWTHQVEGNIGQTGL